MANETFQWLANIALGTLNAVIFLTNLDDKWDLLRPRYGRTVSPRSEEKPKGKGGRRRETR